MQLANGVDRAAAGNDVTTRSCLNRGAQESLIPASVRPARASQLAIHNLQGNSGDCPLGGVRLAGPPALIAG
jgi:hypothetical protein